MSSVVISGDTSGTVTLQAPAVAGSTVLTLPTTSGTLALNQAVVVTDSTNIAMTALLGTSQQNVGSSFSINIPTSGIIKLSSIVGRFLNSAAAAQHYFAFGIRIGTTNYWFNQANNNGTIVITSGAQTINTSAVASIYYETYGGGSGSLGNCLLGTLDIVGLSIPTGTQTVQVVTAYITAAGTIQGAVKQTRITLEFLAT